MFQSFIIMFRETLEAALIVGIVLGYLNKSGQRRQAPAVYLGILAGVAASVLAAYGFMRWAGGFSGRREELFEGVMMLAGALLLTTLILWMMRRSNRAAAIERRVERGLSRKSGLFLLVFVSILREGVESVIFLSAVAGASGVRSLPGALLGLTAALVLGVGLFYGLIHIRLSRFFAVTNVLLILFAAGLVAHGLHELQEAGLVPTVVEHVYDINPAVTSPGSYPLLHEKGHLGSIATGLFGYNGNPSLLELAGYLLYLGAVALLWLRISRRRGLPGAGSAMQGPPR
jgi:high-affinity iron transporter